MSDSLVRFLLIFAGLQHHIGSEPDTSGCPHIQPKIHLDIHKYLGKWYGTELLDNPYSPKLSCVRFHQELTDDHDLSVHMESVKTTGEIFESEGEAVLDPNLTSKFKFFWLGQEYILDVITTDYDHYAAAYACGPDAHGLRSEFGVILSRDKHLPPEVTNYLKDLMLADGIDVLSMYHVDHQDCSEKII